MGSKSSSILNLVKKKSNDKMKFDAKLHLEQLNAMSEVVDKGGIVPELVIMGHLLQGKKIDTRKFFNSKKMAYVGKERRDKN